MGQIWKEVARLVLKVELTTRRRYQSFDKHLSSMEVIIVILQALFGWIHLCPFAFHFRLDAAFLMKLCNITIQN